MSGAHRLAASELSESAAGKKGEAYLKAVEAEMTGDHVADEGCESDNKATSDQSIKVKNI